MTSSLPKHTNLTQMTNGGLTDVKWTMGTLGLGRSLESSYT